MFFDFASFLPRAVMQGIPLLYGSTGIILFFIIGSEFFITYRVSLRKGGKKEA